jgi:signal transduction histidine kinase
MSGMTFDCVLDMIARAPCFDTPEGTAFLDTLRALPRAEPSVVRYGGRPGQVLQFTSDPTADGGWAITVAELDAAGCGSRAAPPPAAGLAAVIDAIPYGVCVYGPDERVTWFNPAYAQVMAGAPLQRGEHRADIIHRRAAAGEYGETHPQEIIARVTARDHSRPIVIHHHRPNGVVIDVRTAALPDGGHISIVTDVTPLTQARAEIERHTAHMEVMLSSIRHGILFWAADHTLIASNAIAGQLLGLAPGFLVPGRHERAVLDHMAANDIWGNGGGASVSALRTRNLSMPQRLLLRTMTGRVVDTRSDPVPGGGWITTLTDVTEAVQSEDALRRAKEAAESANQAKSRFLAAMSHELRTPLNAVIGFSDALPRERRHPPLDRVAEFAQQINAAGRQLLGLINVILDVARIESGRFDLSIDRVDVAALLRDAVRRSNAAAQAAEISLTCEVPDSLPVLRGDERRLRQALGHLLSNAVKFTNSGGAVTTGARVAMEGGLVIFVRDNGIGIAPQDIPRVFEPFTQLDSALARRFSGAGLGLYVTQALVLGHQGQLTLTSAVGRGTTAEITFPPDRLIQDSA